MGDMVTLKKYLQKSDSRKKRIAMVLFIAQMVRLIGSTLPVSVSQLKGVLHAHK